MLGLALLFSDLHEMYTDLVKLFWLLGKKKKAFEIYVVKIYQDGEYSPNIPSILGICQVSI